MPSYSQHIWSAFLSTFLDSTPTGTRGEDKMESPVKGCCDGFGHPGGDDGGGSKRTLCCSWGLQGL